MLRALLLASALLAQEEGPAENRVIDSANGRFCAVMRWDELAPERKTVTASVYETQGRRLLGQVPLQIDRLGEVLVADSGQYLVSAGVRAGCTYRPAESDPLVTVYRIDGARVGALDFSDVFDPYDVMEMPAPRFELRHESDVREVVVVSFMRQTSAVERRIDVATAKLLDEKAAIYPRPRVFVTPVDDGRVRQYTAVECGEAEAVHLDSVELYRRARSAPLPEFPVIAIKARLRGTVAVQLVVSESGDVLCARGSYFPFGVAEAAAEAARQWRFRPLRVNGRPVGFAGELLFHFADSE